MSRIKRCISLLLVLVLAVSMVPVPGAAAAQSPTQVDTGAVTVQGTNGFGNLLSAAITREQAEQENDYEAGYSVTDLEIEGNVATVTYDSLEEAILIVALYTEDGMQLLTTGKATVSPEETEAKVTIDGTMPEYFRASAYLVDSYDYSPLCQAYDTPMYTREMQELLASTVDDYDEDKVLNLDEDKTTNFAVYAETTKVIQSVEGKNIVFSVDEETATYVIKNADEQFTSLKTGDVVAYSYGENELLIVKVKAVSVNGTTVTITGGDDLEMEEVFSHLKIQSVGSTSDMVVDEDSGSEGVTYVGLRDDESVAPNDWGGGVEFERPVLEYKVAEKTNENIEFSGSVGIKIKVKYEYYISWTRQFMQFKYDVEAKISMGYKFKATSSIPKATSLLQLKAFEYSPVAGITIGFEPEFIVEFDVTMEVSFTWAFSGGFSYETGKGGKDLSRKPSSDIDIKLEGNLFFGIDFNPNISVLKVLTKYLANAKLNSLVGLLIKGKLTGYELENFANIGSPEFVHECETCLKIELSVKTDFSLEIKFLKRNLKIKLLAKIGKLGEMYISDTFSEVGKGPCPHLRYRQTISVLNKNGLPVSFGRIEVEELSELLNSNGVTAIYLPKGDHNITAVSGDQSVTQTVKVEEAGKVVLRLGEEPNGSNDDFVFGDVDSEEVTDYGSVLAFGECGAEGDNVTWVLYSSGILRIFGTGAMKDYDYSNYAPWYSAWFNSINRVYIENGVTNVGNLAFYDCYNLTDVTIPESVTMIGDKVFFGCKNLTAIHVAEKNPAFFSDDAGALLNKERTTLILCPAKTSGHYSIPSTVMTIGDFAFDGCSSLTGVTIPDNTTSIGAYAFRSCSSLTSVMIPDSVATIGECAFYWCSGLTSVAMSDSVTTIDDLTFYGCSKLASVTIPDSVTTIGDSAFSGCSSLADVTIPENVSIIGDSAFSGCSRLVGLTIADGVMTVGDSAFSHCSGLTSVTLPNSVTAIGDYAFYNCRNLTSVLFHGNAPTFGSSAFCLSTVSAFYPAGDDTWTPDVLQNYGGTITWVPYTSGEGGDEEVQDPPNMTEKASISDLRPGFEIPEQDFGGREEAVSPNAVYGGEYGTEITQDYTLKTASFTGLVPGGEYLLLALKHMEGEDPLAAENLLFVDQAAAGEDGSLKFTYVQRELAHISYVVACGPSNKNLKDAEITFPEMTADGELQAVEPRVVYDGETLVEGEDYVITGSVSFTEAGEYTCYIRGIRKYTGLVECVYQVLENTAQTLGDLDLDGDVDSDDLTLLARHVARIEEVTGTALANADVTGDGLVNSDDLTKHARYVARIISSWNQE